MSPQARPAGSSYCSSHCSSQARIATEKARAGRLCTVSYQIIRSEERGSVACYQFIAVTVRGSVVVLSGFLLLRIAPRSAPISLAFPLLGETIRQDPAISHHLDRIAQEPPRNSYWNSFSWLPNQAPPVLADTQSRGIPSAQEQATNGGPETPCQGFLVPSDPGTPFSHDDSGLVPTRPTRLNLPPGPHAPSTRNTKVGGGDSHLNSRPNGPLASVSLLFLFPSQKPPGQVFVLKGLSHSHTLTLACAVQNATSSLPASRNATQWGPHTKRSWQGGECHLPSSDVRMKPIVWPVRSLGTLSRAICRSGSRMFLCLLSSRALASRRRKYHRGYCPFFLISSHSF